MQEGSLGGLHATVLSHLPLQHNQPHHRIPPQSPPGPLSSCSLGVSLTTEAPGLPGSLQHLGYRSLRLCMSHNRMVPNLAYIWESLDKLLELRSPFLPYCDFIGSRYSPSTGVFESLVVILLLAAIVENHCPNVALLSPPPQCCNPSKSPTPEILKR